MAKLAATTFEGLNKFLGNKDSRTIGNNTTAERVAPDMIVVRLHGHRIVQLSERAVSVSNAGYGTVTTRDRINQFLPMGVRAVQRNWSQFLSDRDHNLSAMGSGWYTFPL